MPATSGPPNPSDPATVHPVARLPEEWEAVLTRRGEARFRAKQVYKWVHERGIFDPRQMTNLKKPLREALESEGLCEPGRLEHVHRAADGTRKLLFALDQGAKIESVLIPMTPGTSDADAGASDDELEQEGPKKRVTLCISTQFGCAMGCVFCASGQSGLFRGLGAAEVIYQVLTARRHLQRDEELRNIVFMGMGEPLHHYGETARALRLIQHPDGGNMSLRRVTVSTVGLVPGIRRLGEDFGGKVGLAVSLHAADDETRNRIMPMNRRYPVKDLVQALSDYPLPPRRRITIEYTLIRGINDSRRHADMLCELLRKLRVKVNLIPMNPIEASELQAPQDEQVVAFRERLVRNGFSCFVRTRRGDEVSAACGQLALQTIVPGRLVRR